MIYFDNAATTAPLIRVCETMNRVNRDYYANASALHTFGFAAEKLVTAARNKLADFLSVKADCITFTSGGTESNNIAILGYLHANPRAGKHLITSATEHPAVLEVFQALAKDGYEITMIDVDSTGKLDYVQLEAAITPETALISIMSVNNETGAIHDLAEISRIRNRKNPKTILHSDGVQAFGKLLLHPEKTGIDLLSFSAHKIYGPKGIGALYIRKGIRIFPVMYGGGHEKGLRSGTLNTPAIAGFGEAAVFAAENRNSSFQSIKGLKNQLLAEIQSQSFPVIVNGDPETDSPFILNLSFPGVKSEVLLHHLAEKEIYVSSGSACSSNHNRHSHVLSAMSLGADVIDSSIRISFSYSNTMSDVFEIIQQLKEIIPKIKYK